VSNKTREELGLRLIVLYKGTKAFVQLALAAVLVVLAAQGKIAALRETAALLQEHVASRWSLLLGKAIAALVSRRGLRLLEVGLALDAVVSAVEGWSLWRGYRWGEWLVVVATATPLPLEVLAIARAKRPWRLVLALLNVAVVAYLARRLARRRRAKTLARGAPPAPSTPAPRPGSPEP
jgi:uncharacterized membrane protein (DUF2068 family)